MHAGLVIGALWIAFALCWFALAAWSGRTEKRAGIRAEIPYRIVLIAGAIVFFIPAHGYYGPLRLWLVNRTEAWICVGLIVLGFAFSAWARIHLGALWSGTITRKADHRVVDTGPYAIVRHPIYTGILLAVYATAAAKGTVLGLVGALLITIGIWMKARLEERWLRDELGADAYDTYSRRVSMLVPLGPKAG
jgi:protein-S-isoprenylcysteine O-methyltransferase Ste14